MSSFIAISPQRKKKIYWFLEFSFRSPYFSLIKGHSSSDKLWKTEFFVISRNWAEDLVDVNRAAFPPFTSSLGRLRPEGMFFFHISHLFSNFFFTRLTLFLYILM